MFSMMKLVLALKELNISATLFPIVFDSLVNRARNAAVAYFMSEAEATHLLFIDSDIEFDTGDVLKLIQANQPIVGAAYAQKWLDQAKLQKVFSQPNLPPHPLQLCTQHSVHPLPPTPNTPPNLLPVDYLTTGFMLIQKPVIEQLFQAFPQRRYQNDIDGYKGANPNYFYNLFCVEINPLTQRYESEDYGFCRLWRAIGGSIYVLPTIPLTHWGWHGYALQLSRALETAPGDKSDAETSLPHSQPHP